MVTTLVVPDVQVADTVAVALRSDAAFATIGS